MAESLGDAILHLRTDDSGLDAGLTTAKGKTESAVASLQAIGDRAVAVGGRMSLAITAPLTVLATQAIAAATESRQALAQVDSALASMGPTAGRTSEQLQGLAADLENLSIFDDDDILKSVTANMLTFGNVANEEFDRAQQAAVNLSARLGQDLQSSAIQVGKALNDPVKGVTALQRVGVQFTAQQKEQIKAMAAAGDMAGAQGVILGELEKQFGGAAEAQRKATPSAAAEQQWRKLQEIVGEIALKALPPLTALLTKVLAAFNSLDPSVQSFVVGALAAAAAAGPLLMGFGGIAKGIGAVLPLLSRIGPVLTLLAANPAFLAIAALVAGIYLAWQNWDKIAPIIDALGAAVSAWWTANVQPIFDAVGDKVKAVVAIFEEYFGKQLKNIVAIVTALINGDFAGAWEAFKRFVSSAIEGGFKIIQTFAPNVVRTLKALVSNLITIGSEIVAGLASGISKNAAKVWEALKSAVLAGINNIRAFLGIASPSKLFAEIGGYITDGLALGIEAGIPDVEAAMGTLGDRVAYAASQWGVDVDTGAMPGWEPEGGSSADEGPLGAPPPETEESWRSGFRDWFREGLKAAADGNLGDFLGDWLSGLADKMFDGALNSLADMASDLIANILSSVTGGGAGGGGGDMGGIFAQLFGGGFAKGGMAPLNKWSVVGEDGPEPILPRANGTLVRPNSSLRNFARDSQGVGRSIHMPITIDATGADAAALDRVRKSIDQLRAEVPGMALSTVVDAQERRIGGLG